VSYHVAVEDHQGLVHQFKDCLVAAGLKYYCPLQKRYVRWSSCLLAIAPSDP
jgi:hypothetical protein